MNQPATKLFTREELLQRREALFGLPKGRLVALVVIFIVGLTVTLWLKRYIENLEHPKVALTVAGAVVVILPVAFLLSALATAHDQRRKRVLCPCCDKPVLFDITLATHHCGWCGERIVTGESLTHKAPREPAQLPPRSEFVQNFRLASGELNRLGWALLVACSAGLVCLIPLGNWLDAHAATPLIQAAFPVLLILGFLIPIAALAYGLRRAARRHGLHCSTCQRSLLVERRANLAIATGHCPSCGAAAFCEGSHFSAAGEPQPAT